MHIPKKRRDRYVPVVPWGGIVAFVVLALKDTVFSRPAKEAYQYNLRLFWSYEAIMNGTADQPIPEGQQMPAVPAPPTPSQMATPIDSLTN